MGKIVGFFCVLAALISLFIIYVCFLAAMGFKAYSYKQMDWNANGHTSLFELIEAADIETRPVQLEDQICVEYFSLKDGMPVRTDCPSQRSVGFSPRSTSES